MKSVKTSNIIQKILENSSDEQQHQNINTETIEMVIQLDNQKSATILIAIHDDPLTLAKKFCYQYNIDPRVINALANNIRQAKCNINTTPTEEYNNLFEETNKKRAPNSINKTHSTFKKFSSHCDSTLTQHTPKNVFDRLYNDSKVKNSLVKRTSQSFYKQRSINNSNIFPCSQLYDKNVKIKRQNQRKNQQLLELKKLKEQQACTYHPEINPISKIIAHRMRQNRYDLLSTSQQKKQSRIINYLKQKQQKQLQQCTFQPKILNRSAKQAISTHTQRFLLLHQDSNLRQTKRSLAAKKKIKETCSFKPRINHISAAIVSGKSFAERLKQYNCKRNNSKSKSKQRQKQQLMNYHPTTGRGPCNRSRNKSKKNIGQYLYEEGMKKSLMKKNKQNQNKNVQARFITKKSQKIYEQRKKIAMRYLFTLMDNDQDGVISAHHINIIGIDQQILKLIAPLLSQMQEVQAELDEQQFVQSFTRLFNTFSIDQKNKIIQVYKHTINQSNQPPTFQPSLNEKSILMARQNRQPGVGLYEIWKQKFIQKQAWMCQQRALRQLSQYQKCTFQPNLFN